MKPSAEMTGTDLTGPAGFRENELSEPEADTLQAATRTSAWSCNFYLRAMLCLDHHRPPAPEQLRHIFQANAVAHENQRRQLASVAPGPADTVSHRRKVNTALTVPELAAAAAAVENQVAHAMKRFGEAGAMTPEPVGGPSPEQLRMMASRRRMELQTVLKGS